jgi:hypothetical protein
MSTVISISTRRRYGVARICHVWGVARAGVYRRRGATEAAPPTQPGAPGWAHIIPIPIINASAACFCSGLSAL